VRYVIWDFDGTLAFRAGMWSGTLIEVLRREMPTHPATLSDIRPHMQTGFPWNRPELPHHPVRSADEWWEDMCPVFENAFREGAKLTAGDARRLARHVRSAYLRPDSWQLFDDALPCLHALRATGWRHVILSNHVPELPNIIESLGLAPLIDRVFNSAQTGFEKPHAEAFATVLASMDNAPREDGSRIWMIGDSVTADIAGAQAAGLRTVLVRSQHPSADHCSADHCCQTLAEIPAMLNRRLNRPLNRL
jgi:HAD superfamily hydrolase (TIGR01549 family)